MTIYDVICDQCERGFAIDNVWNVEYLDGMSNVLCENCVDDLDLTELLRHPWQ